MMTPIRQPVASFVMLALLAASGCGSDASVDPELPVAAIDVTPTGTINLNVGEKAQLRAVPKGSHGEQLTNRAVTWISANNAIATVSATGEVTAVSGGNTSVTAKSENATSSAVTVVVTAQSQITLSRTTASFENLTGAVPPAGQTVSIVNSGGTPLTGLSVGTIQYTAGQPTGWLAAILSSTTAPSTLTITPQPNSEIMAAGTYTAVVPVVAAGASNTPQNVTVTLVLTAAVDLTIAGGGTGTGTVTIGGATCTITNGVASGVCALRSPSGSTSVLTATPTGTSVFTGWSGACSGSATTCTLTMIANRNVTATFNPPVLTTIAVTTTFIGFVAGQSGTNPIPTVQTVGISNGGSGPLTGLSVSAATYTAGEPTGWLTASLSSTNAPANLDLLPTVGALGPGDYHATVNVTSPVATNSPRTIFVQLTVVAKP